MIELRVLTDVIPDGDDSQRRAQEELARSVYDAAKPTWFDRAAQQVMEFIGDLFNGGKGAFFGPVGAVILVLIVLAALVVAILVWGRPRAPRTVRRRHDLLGERDDRSAAELRAEAEKAAKAGDWDSAVILRYRALARSLLERDLINPAPGATAQAIAREGATALPGLVDELHTAAVLFDSVRYLRTPADAAGYRTISDTDERVRTHRPSAEAVPA